MTNQDKNQVTDPGRTPGQAEGTEDEEQSTRLPQEPVRTPSQAEGDEETVEEDLSQHTA